MDIDTIDFLDPATQENPFASYNALLAQAPVHFMPSIQAYVVSSHAAIRHVVTHPAIWSIDFRARPDAQLIKTPRARALLEAEGFPRDTKLTTDPPAHTAYRAGCWASSRAWPAPLRGRGTSRAASGPSSGPTFRSVSGWGQR